MASNSKIEWTDATWNPLAGCSKVSAGCTNCYAIRATHRLGGNPKTPQYKGLTVLEGGRPNWTGKMVLVESALELPLRWRKPRRIFVNSMSDLFHEAVPDEWIDRIFAVMALCPQHVFQVLTKRPERMREYLNAKQLMLRWGWHAANLLHLRQGLRFDHASIEKASNEAIRREPKFPLPNVWLGVSVEDQETADDRIPPLLQTPAAVRFVSYEPALGPVNFEHLGLSVCRCSDSVHTKHSTHGSKGQALSPLDWVIAGGESGPGARPSHPDWFRSVRDQCAAAGVPFFFKQWGCWVPIPPIAVIGGCEIRQVRRDDLCVSTNGEIHVRDGKRCVHNQGKGDGIQMRRVRKKAAGRLLDGREWNEYPMVKCDAK